jgi:hypothetical protein
MSEEKENKVDEIIMLLGEIDVLMSISDSISESIDKMAGEKYYLDLLGAEKIFNIMENMSKLKSILYKIDGNVIGVSKAQAKHYKKNKSTGAKVNPASLKSVEDFIKIIMTEKKDPQTPSDETVIVPKKSADKDNKKDVKNKYINNAIIYAKDKFSDENKEERQDDDE